MSRYSKLIKITNLLKAFAVLVVVMTLSTTYVLADRTSDDLDDEREQTEEERNQNQSRLDSTNSEIISLEARALDVDEEIEETTAALVQVMAEMTVIENDIAAKENEIGIVTEELAAAIEQENLQYESMMIRIKFLYESNSEDLLSIYMESGSITEALTKAEYVEDLYEYDRMMLEQYQETVREVADLKEKLETEQEELLAIKEDYEEQAEYMNEVIDELKGLSDNYAAQIMTARNQAAEYAAIIEQQNREIAQLQAAADSAREEERRAAEAARSAEAQAVATQVAETGTVTTANNTTYDVTPIYNSGGSETGNAIASFACQFVGNPYVAGGTSLTNGADCSGFTMSVFANFGISLPRTSGDQRYVGYEVPYSEAQPGDLICYPGHVGIYIGNGMIVHASTPSGGIKIGSATYRGITTVRRVY